MNRMIRYLVALCMLGSTVMAFAQSQMDKIIYKNGQEEMVSEVLRRSSQESYILVKDLDGHQKRIEKNQIKTLILITGEEISFPDEVVPENKPKNKPQNKSKNKPNTDKQSTIPHVLLAVRANLPFSNAYEIIPFDLTVEAPIVNLKKAGFLSLGVRGGFDKERWGDSEFNARINHQLIEALVGYHFPVRFIDIHTTVGGGMYHYSVHFNNDAPIDSGFRFGASVDLGVSFYFVPAFGITADFSYGTLCPYGAVALGLAFKF